MRPVECIAFMLIQDERVLAEKRKPTKRVVPGAIALPGGHIEGQESPKEALYREMQEEVGIVPIDIAYVCTLLHRSQEFRKLHYFYRDALGRRDNPARGGIRSVDSAQCVRDLGPRRR